MPDPDELQNRVVQFLTGGHHGRGYAVGYGVARTFGAADIFEAVACPTRITARQRHGGDDPWRGIEQVSDTVTKATGVEHDGAIQKSLAFLSDHAPSNDAPAPPPVKSIPGVLWHDFVAVDGGQLHFHCNGDRETVPLLVQHDAASSIGTVQPITESFIGKRTVFAFDMPGLGDSDRIIPTDGVEVDAYAKLLDQALNALNLNTVDFYGMWGGGFVGLDLAMEPSSRVRRLVMSNVFQHTGDEQKEVIANYTPNVSPVWHGGHLLQCWHQMRDQGIYYPWFKRNRDGVI